MPAVIGLVEKSQKGFLWGLNGADHTSDINSWFFEGVESKRQRLLFLLDTNKAFDSIDHEWIQLVLRKTGFPPWVRFFVRGTLTGVKVAPYFGATPADWIAILRGVKQGCPLSPLLFILCYDPLLYELSKGKFNGCYAFADDLALTAHTLLDFTFAFLTIDEFTHMTGLGINKMKSCVLSSGDEQSKSKLREALASCPGRICHSGSNPCTWEYQSAGTSPWVTSSRSRCAKPKNDCAPQRWRLKAFLFFRAACS